MEYLRRIGYLIKFNWFLKFQSFFYNGIPTKKKRLILKPSLNASFNPSFTMEYLRRKDALIADLQEQKFQSFFYNGIPTKSGATMVMVGIL